MTGGGGKSTTTASAGNPAAWLMGKDDLKVGDYGAGLRPIGPHEVRVQMKAVGICGSDVHYLKHMRIGDFIVKEPMVIGHESAGVVQEVGGGVTHLQVGDRVALEPGIPCRHCHHCKTGLYNLCKEMRFFATPPIHGSLARSVVHPADFCFKLPENVSLEEGAMCEPLSVAVHACRRANVQPGMRVLITGAGPIGLVCLLVSKAFGAGHVTITDVAESRLEVARKLGANNTICVKGKQMSAVVAELGPHPPDVAIDCAGFNDTFNLCLAATESGGKVCLVGMGCNEMTAPMGVASIREVDVVGVFRYRNTYPTCIDLLASGRLDVSPLITHRFDLTGQGFTSEAVSAAFEISGQGGSAIKVMFNL